MKITCTISTRGRLDTTLPLTLMSIVNQTKVPDELIIFQDDDEFVNLTQYNQLYNTIFKLIESKGIKWFCYKGLGGQVKNHEACRQIATSELIWRIDDDNVAESNVCETLYTHFYLDNDNKIGAVGGLVIDPNFDQNQKSFRSQNMVDIFNSQPHQWFKKQDNFQEVVQHLYSTFMYRKDASSPYNTELSRIGHREETLFSHNIFKNNYYLIVDNTITTHHLREDKGGIRSFQDQSMWQKDEEIFKSQMRSWGYLKDEVIIVLDNGLGDHWMFKKLLPQLRKKYEGLQITIGCCYPFVFEDDDVKIESIQYMKDRLGSIDQYNVYKIGGENNIHIIDAYKKIYNLND